MSGILGHSSKPISPGWYRHALLRARNHLKHGHYTAWFRDAIKDEALAAEAQTVESSEDAEASRQALAYAITRRYAAADVE